MVQLRARPKKTVEDYLRLPDTVRTELIDGEFFVSPSPTPRHQDIVLKLSMILFSFLESKRLGKLFIAPLDVVLPSQEVVQPDLVVVLLANQAIIQDRIRGVPDLVIEVLSQEAPERDRIVKRDLYAKNRVREYWIVDDATRSIEVLHLAGGRYEPHGYFQEDDSLVSPLLEGLKLPISK